MTEDKVALSIDLAAAEQALQLAAESGWQAVSLAAVARAMDVPIGSLALRLSTPKLSGCVDLLLDNAMGDGEALDLSSPRERLFEVVMRRLEAMEDRRRGVLAWRKGLAADPTLWPEAAKRRLRTAKRALAFAGLDVSASRDAIALALAAIIDRAERKWTEDVSGDFTGSMASLDGDLRRAEDWMERLNRWQSGSTPRGTGATDGPVEGSSGPLDGESRA